MDSKDILYIWVAIFIYLFISFFIFINNKNDFHEINLELIKLENKINK